MNNLVGIWKLVMTEFVQENGGNIKPLGAAPEGMLIYAENGCMSAQLHSADRGYFEKNNPLNGNDMETRAAFSSYVAYYGTYKVNTEKALVQHYVRGSLFPNHTNSILERSFSFSGDGQILTLRTAPFQVGDQNLVGTLVWSRLK